MWTHLASVAGLAGPRVRRQTVLDDGGEVLLAALVETRQLHLAMTSSNSGRGSSSVSVGGGRIASFRRSLGRATGHGLVSRGESRGLAKGGRIQIKIKIKINRRRDKTTAMQTLSVVARWYRDGVFRREMEVAAFLGELLLLVLLRSGACVTGGPVQCRCLSRGVGGRYLRYLMGPGTPARQHASTR